MKKSFIIASLLISSLTFAGKCRDLAIESFLGNSSYDKYSYEISNDYGLIYPGESIDLTKAHEEWYLYNILYTNIESKVLEVYEIKEEAGGFEYDLVLFDVNTCKFQGTYKVGGYAD